MKREDFNLLYETGTRFNNYFVKNYYKTYNSQMTFLQSAVFDYLINNENVTAKELVEQFELPKQHISKIIQKLENEGFMEKQPGKDKRYFILSVTEKGRCQYAEHIAQTEKMSEELIRQIDDADDFFARLEKVNYYLKQIKK